MKLRSYSLFVFAALTAVFAAGCTKEYASIEQQDDEAIQSYVKSSGLSVQQYGTTGIYYQVLKTGTGAALDFTLKTPVTMTAKGINHDFSAVDTFAAFNRFSDYFGYLRIKGTATTETLARLVSTSGVKEGGSIRVLIPSRLLFGRNPVTNVPGYSTEIPGNTCLDVVMNFYSAANIAAYDETIIKKYLAANGLTGFTRLSTGTYYHIVNAGSTTPITTASTVTVDYTGKLFNGNVFDSSNGTPVAFVLSNLIKGWQDAVPLIQKGGTIEIVVPSSRAYGIGEVTGSTGAISIGAFSSLYFKIQVTDVTN